MIFETTFHGVVGNGKSAYEVWLDQGNTGTEQDFLDSLRGEDGKDGADGKDGYTPIKGVDYFDGADGKDGENGKDGHTPIKGEDYFTPTDVAELVTAVIEALPKYTGEVQA